MTQSTPPQMQARNSTRLVLVALGLAAVAVVLVNLYITAIRNEANARAIKVYLLNRRVLPGERIRKDDVKQVRVPAEFADSFKDLGAMDDLDMNRYIADGELTQRAASTNDVLTYSLFASPGGRDLERNITPGKRLISLPVNSRRVPGELRPGMIVDLQASFNMGGATPAALTVMECIKVTAVGARTMADEREADPGRSRPPSSYRSISIEVSPEEAADLDVIERIMVGEYDLLLRNPADTKINEITRGGINPKVLDLIDKRRREPPAPKK